MFTRARLYQRAALSLAVLAVLGAAGCGGGKSLSPTPPAESGTVRGTVVLPPGQPAGDVVVRVEGTGIEARPNPDGSFTLNGVPAGAYTVSVVSATTNLNAHARVVVGGGAQVRVPTLNLGPGGQIAGIISVFDDGGVPQPRAGATLTVRPSEVGVYTAQGGALPPGAETVDVDPDVRLSGTSADDGTYAIKGVPPGVYVVAASLEGFEGQEQYVFVSSASTAPADFVFGAAPSPQYGVVTGTVTTKNAAGEAVPVAGASIWADVSVPYYGGAGGGEAPPGSTVARPGDGGQIAPDGTSMPYPGWFSAVSDENGAYTLRLPVGRLLLQCRHRDYRDASVEVTVQAGQTATANISLEPLPGERPRLELSAATGKPAYPLGDPVDVTAVLKNTGTVAVPLTFEGRELSLSILRGGETVWVYGAGIPVPVPMPGVDGTLRGRDVLNAVLQPGETREYRVLWNGRGWDGGLAAPGDFVLQAAVYTESASVTAAPVTFRIEPR